MVEIKTLIDTIKATASLLEDTKIKSANIINLLRNYNVVKEVIYSDIKITIEGESAFLLDNSNIEIVTDITNPDLWKEFLSKTELFSKELFIRIEDTGDDNDLLTTDAIERLKPISNRIGTFEVLEYENTVDVNSYSSNMFFAPSYKKVNDFVPLKEETIQVDNSWKGTIGLLNNISITISKDGLFLENIKYQDEFVHKNLYAPNNIDIELIDKLYLKKNGEVLVNARLPEDSVSNILTPEKMKSLPFIKTGDEVEVEMQFTQDKTPLLDSIDAFMSSDESEFAIIQEGNYLVQKRNANAVAMKIASYYLTI